MPTNFTIRVRPGEPIDKVINRFKRKWRDSGLADELRFRSSYMKPSTRRRQKAATARWKASRRVS